MQASDGNMVRTVILAVECPRCGRSWTQRETAPRRVQCSWCEQMVDLVVLGWGYDYVGALFNMQHLALLGRELLTG